MAEHGKLFIALMASRKDHKQVLETMDMMLVGTLLEEAVPELVAALLNTLTTLRRVEEMVPELEVMISEAIQEYALALEVEDEG